MKLPNWLQLKTENEEFITTDRLRVTEVTIDNSLPEVTGKSAINVKMVNRDGSLSFQIHFGAARLDATYIPQLDDDYRIILTK